MRKRGRVTNGAKAAARSWLETSGVNIAKYSGCAGLGADGWHRQLQFRRFVLVACVRNRWLDVEPAEVLSALIAEPLQPEPGREWQFYPLEPVRDMDIHTLWRSRRTIRAALPDLQAALERLDQGPLQKGERPELLPLIHASLHSSLARRGITAEIAAPVIVDLSATDEELRAQFSAWLVSKRNELLSYGREPRRARFTATEFQRWTEHQVLAFIDFQLLFAPLLGLQFTDEVLGHALFPNDVDVGICERVRKTVAPLAELVMSDATLDALEHQVALERYSKKPEEILT